MPANDHELISWLQFGRNNWLNSSSKTSFWDWFYATMKLTRDHLSTQWNKGYIAGFIAKDKAEQLLFTSKLGTFLFRFSDSTMGKWQKQHMKS